MKNLRLLLSAIALIAVGSMQAQVDSRATTSTTTSTTTTTLPDWGVAGADNARYYYLPDMEAYYDVRNQHFVFLKDDQWIKSKEVPEAYRDLDLYDSYKVVITEDGEPYKNYGQMRSTYARGYKGEPQKTVKIKKRKDGTIKIKPKS